MFSLSAMLPNTSHNITSLVILILVFSIQGYYYLKFETDVFIKDSRDFHKRVIPIIVVCYNHGQLKPNSSVKDLYEVLRHRSPSDVVDSIYKKENDLLLFGSSSYGTNINLSSLFSNPETYFNRKQHCFCFDSTGNLEIWFIYSKGSLLNSLEVMKHFQLIYNFKF